MEDTIQTPLRPIDRSIVHERHNLILSTKWRVIQIGEGNDKFGICNTIGHDSNTPSMGEEDTWTPYYVVQDEHRNLSLKSCDDMTGDDAYKDVLTWGNPLDAASFIKTHIA